MKTSKSGLKQKKNISILNKKRNGPPIEYLLLSVLAIVFVFFLNNVSHIQDDAFISFRYIKNFINGNGLVFNIGERVEGYTNFLWTIILAFPAFLKVDVVNFSEILSSFFGIAVLVVTFFISGLINKKTAEKKYIGTSSILLNFVPVFLLTFTGAFAYWASSGMETSFFIFLVLSGLYFYIKGNKSNKANIYTPIFLSLSALTRPEGILFFAIIYTHKLLFIILHKNNIKITIGKILSQNNLVEITIFLVPVLLQILFRLVYYGYPFPNTYYAKVSYNYSAFSSGMEYLLLFAKDYLVYGIIIVLPVWGLFKRKLEFEVSLFYLIIFAYSIFVVIVGGDVLPLHRFWLVILPIIYILWGVFLRDLTNVTFVRKILPGSKAVTILMIISLAIGAYNYLHKMDNIEDIKEREIALVNQFQMQADVINRMEQIRNKKFIIAGTTIGALSYYTDATVIDMLGLTDEYIAHNPEIIPEISNDPSISWKEKRYNPAYIISRKPDYILFSTGSKPSAYAERALFTNNNFFFYYYIQFIPRLNGKHLYYYTRKTEEQIKLTDPKILSAKIDPGWIKDYVNFYQVFHNYRLTRQQFNLVKTNFIRSVKSAPSFFSDDYRMMGDAYYISGDIQRAKEVYDKALSIDSLSVLSYLGLGRIYQNLNDVKKANFYAREMQLKGLVQNNFIRG